MIKSYKICAENKILKSVKSLSLTICQQPLCKCWIIEKKKLQWLWYLSHYRWFCRPTNVNFVLVYDPFFTMNKTNQMGGLVQYKGYVYEEIEQIGQHSFTLSHFYFLSPHLLRENLAIKNNICWKIMYNLRIMHSHSVIKHAYRYGCQVTCIVNTCNIMKG